MKSFESLVGPETRRALDDAAQLVELVSRNVPADAARHLLFCRLHDGKLRLVLDSAAWVARLRFGERALVRTLKQQGLEIRQVSWHISPREQVTVPAPRQTVRQRNARTARLIHSVADDMQDDTLGRAMRRLARQLQPRDD